MATSPNVPIVIELPASLWAEKPENPAKAKEQLNALFEKAYGVPLERVVLNATVDALQTRAFVTSNHWPFVK